MKMGGGHFEKERIMFTEMKVDLIYNNLISQSSQQKR